MDKSKYLLIFVQIILAITVTLVQCKDDFIRLVLHIALGLISRYTTIMYFILAGIHCDVTLITSDK